MSGEKIMGTQPNLDRMANQTQQSKVPDFGSSILTSQRFCHEFQKTEVTKNFPVRTLQPVLVDSSSTIYKMFETFTFSENTTEICFFPK